MKLFEHPEDRFVVEIRVNQELKVPRISLCRYLVLHDGENGVIISLYFDSPKVF